MTRTLELIYAVNCKDCGSYLPKGSKVRYYNNNHIYGLNCHSNEIVNKKQTNTIKESTNNIKTTEKTDEIYMRKIHILSHQLKKYEHINKKLKLENKKFKYEKIFGSTVLICNECTGDGYRNSTACLKCKGVGCFSNN